MHPYIIWFVAAIVLIILEIFVPGFTIATFGVGALFAGIFAIFYHNIYIELLIFSISSFILFLWLRPIVLKTFYKSSENIKTNVDALIGKEAKVTETINNLEFTGRVKIGGEYWKALSDDDSIINEGETVKVLKVDGAKVIVKKV